MDFDREVFKAADVEHRRSLLKKKGLYLPKLGSVLGKDKDFLLRAFIGNVNMLTVQQTFKCPFMFEMECGIPEYTLLVQLAAASKISMLELNLTFGIAEEHMPDAEYILQLIYAYDPKNPLVSLYQRFTKTVRSGLENLDEGDMADLYEFNMLLKRQKSFELDPQERQLLEILSTQGDLIRVLQKEVPAVCMEVAQCGKICTTDQNLYAFQYHILKDFVNRFSPMHKAYLEFCAKNQQRLQSVAQCINGPK